MKQFLKWIKSHETHRFYKEEIHAAIDTYAPSLYQLKNEFNFHSLYYRDEILKILDAYTSRCKPT